MATLDSNALGSIKSIYFQTVEKSDAWGMPNDGPAATLVFSWDGVTRKITLQALFTGTKTQIDTFIDAIDALLDGSQGRGSGYAFATSADDLPKSQSYTVHLEDFSWRWTLDKADNLDYTLKMIQRA